MSRDIKVGSTDQSVYLRALDNTTGLPVTTITHVTSGLSINYRLDAAAVVNIGSLSTLSALTDAHTDGGLKHVVDGYYRVDAPDAAFASGTQTVVSATATGYTFVAACHPLVAYNPQDADGLGLSRVNAAITSRSSHTAANVASLILATPANKLATNASGYITVGTNNDKSGYALTVTPPTAAGIADAVWDEVLSGHVAMGSAGEALGASDTSDIALQVWEVLFDDVVTPDSMGVFVKGKLGLITQPGIVLVSIVASGEVIEIWKGRSRTIVFVVPQASINLTSHTPKFGMTKIAGAGTETLEVVGALTEVGDDYHLTFELATGQTLALAQSPAVTNPYRVNASESYSYHWSISATNGTGSCPQLGEGYVNVKGSDTTCTVPE